MKEDSKRKKVRSKLNIGQPQFGIQMIIASSFTLIAFITIVILSFLLYNLFSNRIITMKTESAEQFLTQTKRTLEDYLRTNRRISDALYYSVIKDTDLSEGSFDDSFNLVYESNKDNLISIALYGKDGRIISSMPVNYDKEASEVISQDWYIKATHEVENLHFSLPHVQNITEDSQEGYHWVISLSRYVELTSDGVPTHGILLIDMKYSGIEQILEKVNSGNTSDYIYLSDEDGNIIYHPKQEMMNAGLYVEETTNNASNPDGSYEQKVQGEDKIVLTKTVSYTGWKLIHVVSKSGYSLGLYKMRSMVIFFICATLLGILFINQQLSRGVTSPLIRLDESIREIENETLNPDIYIGGPKEVEHLGKTLQSYVQTIRELMDEVVEEQELKRRSELDALQSQINPHFLYNTLDSVMWMIEDQQNDGAVYMIKELAKLLRISISKGRTIISIRDEILHAKSYMNIQNIRYKNQFSYTFDIADEILDCCTVKLIIQPLLENAIYHGVQGMEDDGEIIIRGRTDGKEIFLDVMDNGYGMTKDQVDHLLDGEIEEDSSGSKRGNGVGLKNVNSRIKMRFGQEYGLEIESERGEGTTMRIRIPYMTYHADVEKLLNENLHKS